MSFYKMERGWHDSDFFNGETYSERDAWSWMVGAATWEKDAKPINIKGRPLKLKRGQFSHSLRFMAAKFGWKKDKVRRFINKLVLWGMLEYATAIATDQNVLSVCNYSKYQDINKTKRDSKQHNDETGARQERDKEKEDTKKVKEKSLMGFDKFWLDYPRARRGDKNKAESAYKTAITKKGATEEEIYNGVQNYRNSREASSHPKGCAAWINDSRWEIDYLGNEQARGQTGNGSSLSNAIETGTRKAAKSLYDQGAL